MNYKQLSNKNLCISLANKSFNECVDLIKKYELVELRLDLLMLNDKEFEEILKLNTKLIATCRHGESANNDRISVLKNLIDLGADYIDIELDFKNAFFDEIIEYAKKQNCKIIISYHNFEHTPSKTELQNIIDTAKEKKADYVKIATEVKTQKDVLKILSLYEDNDKIIAFGMGEVGRISRVSSLYMGAEFTYVSADDHTKTAAGQLSINEMREIINII